MTFSIGETMNLIEKRDNWWLVEVRGIVGLVPSNYVSPPEQSPPSPAPPPKIVPLTNSGSSSNSSYTSSNSMPSFLGSPQPPRLTLANNVKPKSAEDELKELKVKYDEALHKLQRYEQMYGPLN